MKKQWIVVSAAMLALTAGLVSAANQTSVAATPLAGGKAAMNNTIEQTTDTGQRQVEANEPAETNEAAEVNEPLGPDNDAVQDGPQDGPDDQNEGPESTGK